MKHLPKSEFLSSIAALKAPDPVIAFVEAHKCGLWHACRLLGGFEWSRLFDRCCALLERDGVTPRTRLMLEQVLSLLTLERVDDPDLPFGDYFGLIDICDPVVEEICLLSDGLRHALSSLSSATSD